MKPLEAASLVFRGQFLQVILKRLNLSYALVPNDFKHLSATNMQHLRNRFHVAVRLFSNRSQMTSKCGKNKKVAHEA